MYSIGDRGCIGYSTWVIIVGLFLFLYVLLLYTYWIQICALYTTLYATGDIWFISGHVLMYLKQQHGGYQFHSFGRIWWPLERPF